MTKEEKITLIEEIMELDEGTLSEDSILAEFEEWDSLSKLMLISTAKKEFGIVINTDTLKTFKKVSDICDFLK